MQLWGSRSEWQDWASTQSMGILLANAPAPYLLPLPANAARPPLLQKYWLHTQRAVRSWCAFRYWRGQPVFVDQ